MYFYILLLITVKSIWAIFKRVECDFRRQFMFRVVNCYCYVNGKEDEKVDLNLLILFSRNIVYILYANLAVSNRKSFIVIFYFNLKNWYSISIFMIFHKVIVIKMIFTRIINNQILHDFIPFIYIVT